MGKPGDQAALRNKCSQLLASAHGTLAVCMALMRTHVQLCSCIIACEGVQRSAEQMLAKLDNKATKQGTLPHQATPEAEAWRACSAAGVSIAIGRGR